MSASLDPSQSPEQLGPFLLLERLGQGGMGAVYRARDERDDAVVALKVLKGAGDDPSLLDRFVREGRVLATLDHPGIVGFHGELSVVEGQAFYAMELVEGQDLRKVLRERGALPPQEAVQIVTEVLSALAYAHARDVVHRDVKPPNVLLDTAGRVRLVDFGLARVLESSGLTQTGTVLGTPEYMAPEQAEGLPSEPRTDVYATGILLYELLSGSPPFRAERPLAVLRAHCEAPVPPLQSTHGLPSGLEGVVRRALAKAPADRWPSAEAMGDALAALDFEALSGVHDETVLEPPSSAGATAPLPALGATTPNPVSPNPVSTAEAFAPTAIEAPAAPAPPEEPEHPTRRPLWALVGGVLVVLLAIGGASLSASKASSPVPTPTHGEDRDWGGLGPPGTPGAAEESVMERIRDAGWQAETSKDRGRAAVLWAASSLRTQDLFRRLTDRGRALLSIAAISSPRFVQRQLKSKARAHALNSQGTLAARALEAGGIELVPLEGEVSVLGSTKSLRLLVFSPSGRFLAAAPWFNGQQPRPIEVWDVATKRRVATLGSEHITRTLAWSPSGEWILSGSHNPEDGLMLFRRAGDQAAERFPGTDMRIHVQPCWSPDGKWVMFSSPRGARLSLASGLVMTPFEEASGRFGRTQTIELGNAVAAASWSPGARFLALGGAGEPVGEQEWPRTGKASVLNLATGKSFELEGHERPLTQFSWSPDASRLVSADAVGVIRCWRIARSGEPTPEGRIQGLIEANRAVGDPQPLAWSPDSSYLIGATSAGIALWSGREPAAGATFLNAIYPLRYGSSPAELRWESPGVIRVLSDDEFSALPIEPQLLGVDVGPLLDLAEQRTNTTFAEALRAQPR